MKEFFAKCGTVLSGGAVNIARGIRQRWYYLIIIAVAIGLDQLTKHLAARYLAPVTTVPLWQGVLHLTYLENRGAAFGMLSDHRAVFMIVSTVGILAFFLYLFAKKDHYLLFDIGIAFIIGGGIGNMIDRIAMGYVIDFIDFTLIDFAIFNGADSFVCVGAAMILLSLIIQTMREKKRDTTDDTDRQA